MYHQGLQKHHTPRREPSEALPQGAEKPLHMIGSPFANPRRSSRIAGSHPNHKSVQYTALAFRPSSIGSASIAVWPCLGCDPRPPRPAPCARHARAPPTTSMGSACNPRNSRLHQPLPDTPGWIVQLEMISGSRRMPSGRSSSLHLRMIMRSERLRSTTRSPPHSAR